MKPRTPLYISIPIILLIIMFSFYIFIGSDISIFKHPLFLSTMFIYLILLLIIDLLDRAIFNEKLKFFSKKEKNEIIKSIKEGYFIRLYKSGFYNYKNENIKIINHDFDGILEFDNDLPGWWINLFFISIIFSFIYICAYFFTDFAHSNKEYEISYKKHMMEIYNYEKKRPQATIDTTFFKKNYIEEGEKLFKETCSTCHNIDGGGNTGPNLTDEYWINTPQKELFKNIFYIIWNGSENNPTMRSFGKSGELKGNDIEKISSYIYFINKNIKKPINSKSPQGEKIIWNK